MRISSITPYILLSTCTYTSSFSFITHTATTKPTKCLLSSRTPSLLRQTTGNDDEENDKPVEEEATTTSKEELQSIAMEWAKNQQAMSTSASTPSSQKKKYVIVGGGWGGWGAAKALCQSGLDAEVILLDALPDPTGVSGLQGVIVVIYVIRLY